MIISDLNYLEVVAEASSVVGGGKNIEIIKVNPLEIKNQANVSFLNQVATSTAVAISKEGDAEANSVAKNDATVVQLNQ